LVPIYLHNDRLMHRWRATPLHMMRRISRERNSNKAPAVRFDNSTTGLVSTIHLPFSTHYCCRNSRGRVRGIKLSECLHCLHNADFIFTYNITTVLCSPSRWHPIEYCAISSANYRFPCVDLCRENQLSAVEESVHYVEFFACHWCNMSAGHSLGCFSYYIYCILAIYVVSYYLRQ